MSLRPIAVIAAVAVAAALGVAGVAAAAGLLKLRHQASLYADAQGGALRYPQGVGCGAGDLFLVADSGNGRILKLEVSGTLARVTGVVKLPEMIARKKGKIVSITSDAGKVGQSGEAVYSGTKGAVIAWSKSLARENARYGLNINCVAPGPTETKLELAQDPEVIQRVVKAIPFRRFAKPAEQAAMISFLCGPDSDFITGQVFSVSGGLTMI